MKRIFIPFIPLAVMAVAAAPSMHPAPAQPRTPAAAPIHSESAAGSVKLPAVARRPGDDAERALARARLRQGEAGTYMNEMLLSRDSALARWHARPNDPVTIWVQERPDIANWDPGFVDAVDNAFMEWDSLELPVRFRIVRDSADAEVHVTWIDHFDAPISGRTRWSRDDDWWIVDASIVLAVHHQKGEVLDRSSMKAMALHEVGHLLGLDHTNNPESIMAPRVRVRDLSPMDEATVRLLYSVPAGTLRQ
jgi:predicted Zn-dependent protease